MGTLEPHGGIPSELTFSVDTLGTNEVTKAGRVLMEALENFGSPKQSEALEILGESLARLLRRDKELGLPQDAALVMDLMPGLSENIMRRFHILLRTLHPRWINGGEMMQSRMAPPFDAVKEDLMKALDSGVIDYEGFAAILIGRYGPEAKSVLPELVSRLRKFRTDCSKAPGLTWAVYMVGGLSSPVKEVLLEVARGEDSCPHSKPLAIEILQMNEVEI